MDASDSQSNVAQPDFTWSGRTYSTQEFEEYVRSLEARASQIPANPTLSQQVNPPATPVALTNDLANRPRHRLPHLHKFSGKREDWQQWNLSAILKLKTDHEAIGSLRDQFTYLYMAMDTAPQSRIAAWVQGAIENGNETPEAFLRQAKTAFSDPNEQQNAHTRLTNMRQGREAFHRFLPKFEGELARAGGALWDDTVQVNYLRTTLNEELARAIITARLPRDNYHGFKDGVLAIDADLQALKASKPTRTHPSNFSTPKGDNHGDMMEWEPTRANNRKKVSQMEIEKRKEAGACIKCGRKGHFGKECRTGWRSNPALPLSKANQGTVEEDQEDDEQLKE